MNIFVSYTTRDPQVTKALLSHVSLGLSQFGRTFVDALDNNAEEHQQEVETQLRCADVVVALESEFSCLSPWMQWELSSALLLRIPILYLPSPYAITAIHKKNLNRIAEGSRPKENKRVLANVIPAVVFDRLKAVKGRDK